MLRHFAYPEKNVTKKRNWVHAVFGRQEKERKVLTGSCLAEKRGISCIWWGRGFQLLQGVGDVYLKSV